MKRQRSISVKLHEKKTVFIEYIKVKYGDVISWEAYDSDITVFIPDALTLFGSKARIFDVVKGEQISLKIIKKLKRGEVEKYYYAVYHKKFKDFAVSNSSPAIIIMG
jgi:hypothetical protein